jgi:hypothetical protein
MSFGLLALIGAAGLLGPLLALPGRWPARPGRRRRPNRCRRGSGPASAQWLPGIRAVVARHPRSGCPASAQWLPGIRAVVAPSWPFPRTPADLR